MVRVTGILWISRSNGMARVWGRSGRQYRRPVFAKRPDLLRLLATNFQSRDIPGPMPDVEDMTESKRSLPTGRRADFSIPQSWFQSFRSPGEDNEDRHRLESRASLPYRYFTVQQRISGKLRKFLFKLPIIYLG
uniref:Uncharacterized protein n=1 Tax=Romanomermis culicivorax TaxID=13658 RepID=A0A915KDA9_ROMCU